MTEHYSEAIKHLEQAQQELRAVIDPKKSAEQTSLMITIMRIDMDKKRIAVTHMNENKIDFPLKPAYESYEPYSVVENYD